MPKAIEALSQILVAQEHDGFRGDLTSQCSLLGSVFDAFGSLDGVVPGVEFFDDVQDTSHHVGVDVAPRGLGHDVGQLVGSLNIRSLVDTTGDAVT